MLPERKLVTRSETAEPAFVNFTPTPWLGHLSAMFIEILAWVRAHGDNYVQDHFMARPGAWPATETPSFGREVTN